MQINGKEVNLDDVVPLKVRDWRELEKHGITLKKLQEESVEHIARFVTFCGGKGNPDIKRDDVDDLTLDELVGVCNKFLPQMERKQTDFG